MEQHFTQDELFVITKLWKDLTEQSFNDSLGIDLNVFKRYTTIDGFIGERLFTVFDKGNNKFINLIDFIDGLQIIYFGNYNDQMCLLFNLFDVKNERKIEKKYMSIIVNSIPHKVICNCIHKHNNLTYDEWTNNCVCREAFQYDITHKNDYLTFDEFCEWQKNSTIIIDYIKKSINYFVPETVNLSKKPSKSKSDILPTLTIHNRYESYMYKKGYTFGSYIKRYYMLYGNCLYYYYNKNSIKPKGVIFISGAIINSINENAIEIIMEGKTRHKKRILYCENSAIRHAWLNVLKTASQVINFNESYSIGDELGKGAFGTVNKCVRIIDNKLFAVKIIDKTKFTDNDKECLKNELSILKLVCHPNIIHMDCFYENSNNIYFVMEFIEEGDLFNSIIKRKVYNDYELKRLIKNISDCLAYIHDLGIVHRDIKPENILCADDRLVLTDFGLSQFVMPNLQLYETCGTLDYVAPEVISKSGYDKQSDIWSLGVICYLVYYGRLPFTGENDRDTFDNIYLKQPVFSNTKNILANELIEKMLDKNPKTRITAQEILNHKFIK